MNSIDWVKIIEFIMPVILLLSGGFLAVDKMKRNIKLEAKLKWKEEFRSKLVNFIEKSMEIHSKAFFLSITNEDSDKAQISDKFVQISKDLDSAFYGLDIMLKNNNELFDSMLESYGKIKEEAFEVFENKRDSYSDCIDDFYNYAKEIYNDKDYLNKII